MGNSSVSWFSRHRVWCPVAALVLLFWVVLPAFAEVQDLGVLPNGSFSHGSAISADGRVVVGSATDAGGAAWLFRWSAGQGMQGLTRYSGFGGAYAVSGDGGVVAGVLQIGGVERAFRWDAASGFSDLGTLGGTTSLAWGISNDGTVVVGEARNAAEVRRAFRWTAGAGMQDLGGLQVNGASIAYAVSGDGAVTVGTAAGNNGLRAVRWQGGQVLDLGVLPSYTVSGAFGVNGDGSVVVGSSGAMAFRWTAADGMQGLGMLDGTSSTASDVSADGKVVVGFVSQADGTLRAYRWTAASGMTRLGLLAGGSYSEALAISDDGEVIVGYADNPLGERAVIWKANSVQDLAHLQQSVADSAARSAQLSSQQGRRSRYLAEQQCIPGAEQRYCLSLGGGLNRDDSREGFGLGGLGVRLTPHLAMGAAVSVAPSAWQAGTPRQSSDYGLGVWLVGQQDADSGLGWNASVSMAASTGDARLQRGERLADVQRTATDVTLRSAAQRLAVGYGLALGTTVLTPELALSHVRSQRGGFSERGVALPLRVQAADSEATYATFALRSSTPLSTRATLQMHLAVDTLLREHTADFTGTSQIPGLDHFSLSNPQSNRHLVPAAGASLRYALSDNASVATQVQVAASTLAHARPLYGLAVEYRYSF